MDRPGEVRQISFLRRGLMNKKPARFRVLARRWCTAGLTLVLGLMLAMSGATPALAITPGGGGTGGGGGGGGGGVNPCSVDFTSFSVTPTTIFLGQPVTASWTVRRAGPA